MLPSTSSIVFVGPVIPGSRRNRPAKNRPPAGPFQNSRLSSAAQTHRLKKLRSASKCRDCDSYVYFNGAECEVCGLTCHKKCLAKLSIECGTYTVGDFLILSVCPHNGKVKRHLRGLHRNLHPECETRAKMSLCIHQAL